MAQQYQLARSAGQVDDMHTLRKFGARVLGKMLVSFCSPIPLNLAYMLN